VDAGPLTASRDLRAHWRVLDGAASECTVLPVRFGTVLDDDESVKERLLAPNAGRLRALLEELTGRVQLVVKAFYDEERLMREVVQGSREVAQLRERLRRLPGAAGYYDRIRLGELVAAEVGRRRERDAALVLEVLEPLAVASRTEEAGTPDTAVNAAFLVERRRVDEFSSGVSALSDQHGQRLRFRYVGPLPPYSFADAELTAESSSWG
jgi:Gas vesicle synthesis protein GvpL/GvpF